MANPDCRRSQAGPPLEAAEIEDREDHRQSSESGREEVAARIALRFGRRDAPLPPREGGEGLRDGQIAPSLRSLPREREEEGADVRDTEADMPKTEVRGAMCVQRFDDSRALQFTLRIAVRCVLHRCGSLDIRR